MSAFGGSDGRCIDGGGWDRPWLLFCLFASTFVADIFVACFLMPDGANLEIILFCGTAEKTTAEYQNVPSGHFGASLCPVPTVGVSVSLGQP